MKVIKVTGAIIQEGNKFLICRRGPSEKAAGLWEFPGGKLEINESLEDCILRELKEELDIDTHESCLAPVNFSSYQYPDFQILLLLFICRKWQGIPRPLFASKLKWVFANDLRKYDMPKANKDFISNLQDLL